MILDDLAQYFFFFLSYFPIFEIDIVRSITIIILVLIFSKFVLILFQKYIHCFTDKTETDIDDKILKIITKPIYVLIILIGLKYAVFTMNAFSNYFETINKVFFVLLAVIVTWMISRVINLMIINWLKVEKKFEKTPKLVTKIISIVIYLVLFLVILDYFEISITPLLASFGVGGLAVGLALQGTLSNFFAGLHIISDKPISVGDYIELENGKIAGFVEDINWRSIRLKTYSNNLIIIPNNTLANSIIQNRSAPTEVQSAVVGAGVAYDSDLEKVEKILLEIGNQIKKEHKDKVVQEFDPLAKFYEFGDSNIKFKIILRAKTLGDKFFIMHLVIKTIKARFDKEGIEISFPVRKLWFANNPQE